MNPDECWAYQGEHVQPGPYDTCACGWDYGWCPTLTLEEIARRKQIRLSN